MVKTKTKTIKKQQAGRTYVTIVLDRSGSIAFNSLTNAMIAAVNGRINTLREEAKAKNLDVYLSLLTFSDDVNVVFGYTPIANVLPLERKDYFPSGNTALFDGIGIAIERASVIADVCSSDAFLIETITDGVENVSRLYRGGVREGFSDCRRDIVETMNLKTRHGNFTFAFQLPKGYGQQFARKYGVSTDNIHEWEQTVQGAEEGTICTQSALAGYLDARSAGTRSVKAFYKPVTVDLSDLTAKDIKKNLDDISSRYKSYKVEAEEDISSFVERKTKRPYQKGTVFYQLSKPEKIAATKEVLLMEAGKNEVWGGRQARDLIGLPHGKDAKVTPHSLAAFQVFCQSTSTNRKLVRGTKVLVEKV